MERNGHAHLSLQRTGRLEQGPWHGEGREGDDLNDKKTSTYTSPGRTQSMQLWKTNASTMILQKLSLQLSQNQQTDRHIHITNI